MRSVFGFVAVLVVSVAAAGCSSADDLPEISPVPDDGGEAAGFGGNNTTEEAAPPPPQELLNTTLAYPRAPGQPDASESFTVPGDAMGLRIYYQAVHDCPTPSLGYQDTAAIVVEPPGGEPITEELFQSGAGTVDCNNTPQRHHMNPNPAPGEWVVRTSGVYSGSVSVAAIANPSGIAE